MHEFKFSNSMYERLFKHNIMPLFICDKKGEIIAYNKKFKKLYGKKATLKNKNFSEIFKPESKEEKQKFSLIEFGFFEESDAHDLIFNTIKGEKRYVRLWIDAKFDEDLSLAAVEDYTDKRKLELKLTKQNLKLKELKDELEDFNKNLEKKVDKRTKEVKQANKQIKILLERKNQFINELAHDLRTPLTPITYLIESIKEDINNKEMLKDIQIIENNTNYLKNLVEDILKLARIDNNKVEFNFEGANIYDVVQNVIINNQVTFNKLKIRTENKISKKTPEVYIDKLKITEVLENLVMNSTKFMKKGGKLTFSTKKKDNFIIVSVKDDGIGIDKKHLQKIFHEFYKADSSRHHKGSGLGLSICKRIIEKHGGKIWAESKGKGKGTAIKFTIKLLKSIRKSEMKKQKPNNTDIDKKYVNKLKKLKEKLKKN
ncbi:PAS domain S-box protein [Candidatus Woesearchaeota archaeon]|nr:PAS domain S-box protein [Candidatus Woesearchaeota archaeon]